MAHPSQRILFLCLACLLAAGLAGPQLSARAEVDAGACRFGYTVTSSTFDPASNWTEINATGTPVTFTYGVDDSVAGPFDMNFDAPVKFFEHAFNSIYISTNGFVAFAEGTPFAASLNDTIPSDVLPNNIIAPFWDDLVVGGGFNSGKAYYKTVDAGANKKFIVEYDNVTQLGKSDLLTFQVILYQNGNIEFKYRVLEGDLASSTVGIEDGDGVDGLEVIYNGASNPAVSGLAANRAYLFTYPGQNFRHKVLPVYESQFTRERTALLPLTVQNISDGTPPENYTDTYNVAWAKSGGGAGWTYALLGPDKTTPLADTNSDGQPDTGALALGDSKTIYLRLTAPSGAPLGDYQSGALTFTSSAQPTKSVSAAIQTAIAAPYLQADSDSARGIQLFAANTTTSFIRQVTPETDFYKGFALQRIASGKYLLAWSLSSSPHVNLQYSKVSITAGQLSAPQLLTDNTGAAVTTRDKVPAIGITPDGQTIGVAFVRTEYLTGGQRSNVYFQRLDSTGAPSGSPINVTNNTNVGGTDDPGVPQFSNVTVVGTSDQKLVLAWSRQMVEDNVSKLDIAATAFDPVGGAVGSIYYLTSSTSSLTYDSPNLSELNNGKAFLSYFVNDTTNLLEPYRLEGVFLNSGGQKSGAAFKIAGSSGLSNDSVQLSNGAVLIAWTRPDTFRVNYALWSASGVELSAPRAIPMPDGRRADLVSVTRDSNQHGIITWQNSQPDRIYYALVDGLGNLVTPAMIAQYGAGTPPYLHTGAGSMASAALPDPLDWPSYLPRVRK